ncbi:MAG: response regulator [Cytophagaceae bacterium]|nr:MAG: response regulator [Cytophagaceae bacterium]
MYNEQGTTNNFKNACVLVVEDSNDQWVLIQQAMYKVLPEIRPVRVASHPQVQTLLAEWVQYGLEIPKLVLLDLYLPQPEQGWQVLTAIKSLPSPYNILPVVMLSSSSDQDDISEAYRRGCLAYVIKPILFAGWLAYFWQLRTYWWETATLPEVRPTPFF